MNVKETFIDHGINVIPCFEKQAKVFVPCALPYGKFGYKTQDDGEVILDKNGKPANNTYAIFKDRSITREEFESIKPNCEAVAMICGPTSGNLFAFDMDLKNCAPNATQEDKDALWERIKQEVGEQSAGEIFNKMPLVKTRSNGYHLLFRCETPVQGTTLATSIDTGRTTIEIIGAKQLLFAYPTPGYSFVRGGYDSIPTLTEAEVDQFTDICRVFNEMPEVERIAPKTKRASKGDLSSEQEHDLPLSTYDRDTSADDVLEVLTGSQWSYSHTTTKYIFVTRPNKKVVDGVSGSISIDTGRFFCFSSSTSFIQSIPHGVSHPYSPSQVLCHLEYGDDFSKLAKDLFSKGIGSFPENSDVTHVNKPANKQTDSDTLIQITGKDKEYCDKLPKYCTKAILNLGFSLEWYSKLFEKPGKDPFKFYNIPLVPLTELIGLNWVCMPEYGMYFKKLKSGDVDYSRMIKKADFINNLRDCGVGKKMSLTTILDSDKIEVISPMSILYNLIDNVEWDGTSRLQETINSLNLTYGDFDKEDVDALITKWFVLTCAFAFKDIDPDFMKMRKVMNRVVLILFSSARHLGKTEWFRTIGGQDILSQYFIENNIKNAEFDTYSECEGELPADSRQFHNSMSQSLVMLFDDIDNLLINPKTKDKLKSIVSTKKSDKRLLHKEDTIKTVRTCSFGGTTNNVAPLRDAHETRYLVLKMEKQTDWDFLDQLDVIQLWKEVMIQTKERANNGEPMGWSIDENELIKEVIGQYVFTSPMEDTISELFQYDPLGMMEFSEIETAYVNKIAPPGNENLSFFIPKHSELTKALKTLAQDNEMKVRRKVGEKRMTYWRYKLL